MSVTLQGIGADFMKLKRLIIVGTSMLMLSAVGYKTVDAKPIYLNCHFVDSRGLQQYSVTVDEANQYVQYLFHNTGVVNRRTGIFKPDEVSFVGISNSTMNLIFRINRVTLAFQISLTIGSNPPRVENGVCALVAEPQERKF
jgi:hypothetical protein